MSDWSTTQGDTAPLEIELTQSLPGDWTLDGSVTVTIKRNGSGQPIIVDDAPCEIISGSDHTVRWRPSAADTNVTPGPYLAQFTNLDSGGVTRTFPSGKGDEPDFYEFEINRRL